MLGIWAVVVGLALIACGGDDSGSGVEDLLSPDPSPAPVATSAPDSLGAHIIGVEASGAAGAFTFAVTVASPDLGCEQYADWWEVLDADGALLYRRVLLHSHVSEQPFTRTGGPVPVAADQLVWVRAHMNTSGYGGAAYKGSVQDGFQAAALDRDFAATVARQTPLPEGCNF